MRALELHHGPLAGGVLGADDDESPSALVDAVHDLEGDELSHCPVSLMDAAPGLIHCGLTGNTTFKNILWEGDKNF